MVQVYQPNHSTHMHSYLCLDFSSEQLKAHRIVLDDFGRQNRMLNFFLYNKGLTIVHHRIILKII